MLFVIFYDKETNIFGHLLLKYLCLSYTFPPEVISVSGHHATHYK